MVVQLIVQYSLDGFVISLWRKENQLVYQYQLQASPITTHIDCQGLIKLISISKLFPLQFFLPMLSKAKLHLQLLIQLLKLTTIHQQVKSQPLLLSLEIYKIYHIPLPLTLEDYLFMPHQSQ
jgi:hypothetical protein